MTDTDATALLSTERLLRFHRLEAGPRYDGLTVWVDGARPQPEAVSAGTGNADLDKLLGPGQRVEARPGALRYKVVFDICLVYAVRDESIALPEPDDDYSTMLRRYDRSAFLDYVARSTYGRNEADAPLRHIALVTLDMIVDVACLDAPRITATVIGPDDPGPLPGLPQEMG